MKVSNYSIQEYFWVARPRETSRQFNNLKTICQLHI
jgi:hypothetical protein